MLVWFVHARTRWVLWGDPLATVFICWRVHCCPRCCARYCLLHHPKRGPRGRAGEDGVSPFITWGRGGRVDLVISESASGHTLLDVVIADRFLGCAKERTALQWAAAKGYLHSYRHRHIRYAIVSNIWIPARLRSASIFRAQRIIPVY